MIISVWRQILREDTQVPSSSPGGSLMPLSKALSVENMFLTCFRHSVRTLILSEAGCSFRSPCGYPHIKANSLPAHISACCTWQTDHLGWRVVYQTPEAPYSRDTCTNRSLRIKVHCTNWWTSGSAFTMTAPASYLQEEKERMVCHNWGKLGGDQEVDIKLGRFPSLTGKETGVFCLYPSSWWPPAFCEDRISCSHSQKPAK